MNKLLKAAVYVSAVSSASILGAIYGAIESGLSAHHSARKALAQADQRVEKSKLS